MPDEAPSVAHATPANSARLIPARERLLATVGGLETFQSSFNWRTHTPDRRAESELRDAVTDMTDTALRLAGAGVDVALIDQWTERYIAKWVKYQAAGARTANWMITGPANFPVERNRRRMEIEHARGDELIAHVKGALDWARRRAHLTERAALAANDTAAHETRVVAGVTLTRNTTLDRVQLTFPDKPSDAERALLKRQAFRWAPSLGVWQRQLTRNGLIAADTVLKQIAELEPTA